MVLIKYLSMAVTADVLLILAGAAPMPYCLIAGAVGGFFVGHLAGKAINGEMA